MMLRNLKMFLIRIKKEHYLEQAVMDKAYGSKDIRNILEQNKIEPVIPCKSNSKEQIAHDKESYKLRNKVERFFNKIKQFRRIATRYENYRGHLRRLFI